KAEKEKRQQERLAAIELRTRGEKQKAPEEKERKWREKEVVTYTVPTLPGQKKVTTGPMPESYSPSYVEAAWYSWWETQGFFKPEYHPHKSGVSGCSGSGNFIALLVTVRLSLSMHVVPFRTSSYIKQPLMRRHRMKGWKVLWVPGCDHAGIATQAVVEKKLQKETGLLRQDLGREQFLQAVWRWKEEKGDEIYHQLRRLGASLEWGRACFTMDQPPTSEIVATKFLGFKKKGLLYRHETMLLVGAWRCELLSPFFSAQVEMLQLKGRTFLSVPGYKKTIPFGVMVKFAYKLEGGGEQEVVVATTRPETMLGDVAVVVHPDDPRYAHLHGKQVEHPFTGQSLPVLTDPLVERSLGTGAVKVTPGHDYSDYELGLRHGLPLVSVIGEDGRMSSESGDWLKGVERFLAREKVIEALAERGLYRGSQSHPMVLPLCSRSGDVVEPLLKEQWFIRCGGMAQDAMEAVNRGCLTLFPQFHEKTWRNWMGNVSDWCVSRQLWWGHQIPAYRVSFPGSGDADQSDCNALWVVGRTEHDARLKAAEKFGKPLEELTLTRDADVLDTWFSSALFPFAMLGWPEETPDLQNFYPNSLLETGSDLIFFWVARMVMLGRQLTGQLPFSKVFFHSMVRDAHGRKMSKSLGNVINPLDVITGISLEHLHQKLEEGNLDPRETAIATEGQRRDFPQGIPECGTDALRFALCSYKCHGDDINLDVKLVHSARHFCNKIWNAMKFTFAALGPDFRAPLGDQIAPESPVDHWICSRLHQAAAACNRGFEELDFNAATSAIRSFWLHSLCDVYLECVKPVLQSGDTPPVQVVQRVLYFCTERALCLLAPFMPYLTEELWQRLPRPGGNAAPSVCVTTYPTAAELAKWYNPEEEANFLLVQEVVHVVRSLRADYQLTKQKPELYVACSEDRARRVLDSYHLALRTLSRCSSVTLLDAEGGVPSGCAVGIVSKECRVHLRLEGLVDSERELEKLRRRRERLQSQLAAVVNKTEIQGYEHGVPETVQQETAAKISTLEEKLAQVEKASRTFQQLLKSQS
uniref:valine--tRNA ligase n=1 Tax=Latimeria chalumnae TaxID=7897 RepID=H2ZWJ3_LATCH